MPKIVISYRHKDTTAIAGRICDKLRNHYGDQSVFMDASSIRYGIDFRSQIAKALHSCDLVVAIIGRKWLGEVRKGSPRIKDEHDFIRIEIETALKSHIPIIPVLVDEASMPKPEELPDSIQQLSYLHAAPVDAGRDFHQDMDALIRDMQLLLAGEEAQERQQKPMRPFGGWSKEAFKANLMKTSRTKRAAVLTSILIALAGASIYAVATPKLPEGRSSAHLSIKPLTSDVKELRSIAFSPDKTMLAVAGDDGLIRLWNAHSFRLEREIPSLHYRTSQKLTPTRKIAFSPAGDRLFSVGFDNKIRIWDMLTGGLLSTLDPEPGSSVSTLYSLAVFPRKDDDKQWVAAGGDDACLRIWQIDKQNTPVVWKYVSGDEDRLSKRCDPPSPNIAVRSIDYSPQGRGVYAAGSADGSVFFLNEQAQARRVFAHHGRAVTQVSFSPDGERLATAGTDRLISLWRFDDRQNLGLLAGHNNSVSSLAWEDNGGRLLSGSEDKTVRLWDPAKGIELAKFEGREGHTKDVQAVAFHPNGKWIVSASQDGMLKVWHAKLQELVLTAVAFDDGMHIVYDRSGTFTGSVGVGRHIIINSVKDGIETPVSDGEKSAQYVSPDVFASRIQLDHGRQAMR
jgi:WD40 repeat protein